MIDDERVKARRAYAKAWRLANLEHCRAYARRYYLAAYHADPCAKQRQLANKHANIERYRGYANAWTARNPDKVRALNHSRRAGIVTPETMAQAIENADGICAYCLRRKPLTIDHVVPVSRSGTNDLDNLVSACKSCNSSKRDRTPLEFVCGLSKLGI